jgi:fructose-1,6-bisphosphatase I
MTETEKNKTTVTLDRFLVQRQNNYPGATGELTRVLEQIGFVAKFIATHMRRAALEGWIGVTGKTNVHGEAVKKLDELGNQAFVEAFDYVDLVGAIVSEELEKPLTVPSETDSAKYAVLVDPVDGSSNLRVDCVVGSIFSVRRMGASIESSLLEKGTTQIAAGYVLYGPATLFVYTAGDGVHSFVLDEQIGEFVLDHEAMRIPEQGSIVSANLGNYPRWYDSAKDFWQALMAKNEGRHSLRYSGALAADLHQILHRGGIYFYPQDDRRPEGKLRLLYECAPLAMVAEQAGGAATTGTQSVLDVTPQAVHQRIPFAIGSHNEIAHYANAHKHQAV